MKIEAFFYIKKNINYSLSIKNSITSSLTPVNENPPSWKRFCIVTFLVKSENNVRQ